MTITETEKYPRKQENRTFPQTSAAQDSYNSLGIEQNAPQLPEQFYKIFEDA